MAISSNHIQSNSGQLYTVQMAFAAADCSAEGTVSILNRGLDVHGGAAAGGLLLLLGLHRNPKPQGESPKTWIYWENKPLVMWMSFLANKSSNVISQQISTCKKELSTIGLALLQKNIEHHYILQDFLAFNPPQSSHSSFLFRINHNNSST